MSNGDAHGTTVLKGDGTLHKSLAEGAATDDCGPVVVLKGP